MAASASPSQVLSGKYDVFISFRGSDVRSGFLSHLTKQLHHKCIDVYVDDRLERGEEISSALVKAIEGSVIALVIFSEDYASSKWCLEELVKIMECKEANQQIVIPVFYHVDPSDVRHQKRTYADAFTHHEHKSRNNVDKLQIWRSVLNKTAQLSGYHLSNFQNESELIDAIVEDVFGKLKDNSYPIMPKSQLIGFHQNFISVESLIEIGPQEVRVIGIWGMAGIGKTTLARAIFDKFLSQFESRCFIENVKELERINGLSFLHQKLLSELIDQEDLRKNKNFAMRRLQRKKVLIVLDDVDDPKHLKYLAGQQLSLGLGSRVIATSRDKHVLKSGGIQDKYIHEVRELNFEQSLELFSIHAFNQSHPNMGYEVLSEKTVAFAKGIPLALEVLGSHFNSRDKAYWESELSKLQKYPHPEIQNILKVSYDGLDVVDKEICLDIAFFFVGEEKDSITCVLEACGFNAVSGIQNLMDKALIKTNRHSNIVMHDLIREMAEQIVREECMKHPERRSRLKDTDEIYDLLKSNKGTNEIEGIILEMCRIKNLRLRTDIFTKMKNLRILKFFSSTTTWSNNSTYMELPDGLDYLPDKLRYFRWDHYPLESLPLGFCPNNLVELRMPKSNAKKLWDGDRVLDLGNLKKIDLSWSRNLVELPDLSESRKLKIVDLSYCPSLRSVHPSILSLHSIVKLDVSFCHELESLESETHLDSLSTVNAPYCDMLKKFCLSSKKLREIALPQSPVEILHLPIGRCTELRRLNLLGNRLRSLRIDELCCLTNLEEFAVYDFKQVIHTRELHSLFDAWRNLRTLRLDSCCYLSEIPDNIKGLTMLNFLSLEGSSVEILPAWISHLLSLKSIHVTGCKSLKSILGLPPFLRGLDAADCTLLETVSPDPLPCDICYLDFRNCVKLDERSLCIMEELTHSTMTSLYYEGDEDYYRKVIYAGSRVPEWMQYRPMPQPSNAIQFTYNAEPSHAILFCCVAPRLVSERFDHVWCYFSIDGDIWYSEYDEHKEDIFEMDSDHVFLWHMKMDKNDVGTGDSAKVSCEFFLSYWDEEKHMATEVPLEACGIHVVYLSELEWEWESDSDSDSDSDPESESESESEVGRKRKRDADEEGGPPTKKLENNCGVSQPTPIGLELDQSE